MPLLDRIKLRICIFKFYFSLPDKSVRYTWCNKLVTSILMDFENKLLSKTVHMLISYVLKAKTPGALLRRFDDVAFFIRHLSSLSLSPTQQKCARELISIMSRQREVLILSFIRFWSQTGKSAYLKLLLRQHSQRLSHSVRAYLKHELAAWDIYIYCSVRFPSSGKTYYYLTDDSTLCAGDSVLVPVGDENTLSSATVVKVEHFTYDTVPLPLSRTKKIHSRID